MPDTNTNSPAESPIAMLQRLSLPGLVSRELETMILHGELMPGDKLNEVALAEKLGVSRGPVREAFRALEEAGLVRQEKNRGVYVREIARQEAEEIFDVRASLEALAGGELARRATPVLLAPLAGLLDEMAAACTAADADRYHALNLAYHDRLVELAGNRTLLDIYRRLVKQIALFRRRNYRHSTVLGQSLAEHRQIFELIAAGDATAAAAALQAHVAGSKQRMQQQEELAPSQQESRA